MRRESHTAIDTDIAIDTAIDIAIDTDYLANTHCFCISVSVSVVVLLLSAELQVSGLSKINLSRQQQCVLSCYCPNPDLIVVY